MEGPIRTLFALLCLVCSTPVLADKRSTIVIPGLHLSSNSLEDAQLQVEELGKLLARHDDLVVVGPTEFMRQLAGREELILESFYLGEGRRALSEGRLLYERAEFSAAIPVLQNAGRSLEKGLSQTPEIRALYEALLLLGLCHSATGDEPQARRVLARLVELNPTRELDPIHYPPRVISLYQEVWESVHRQQFGQLAIEVENSQIAEVWVDGISRGNTPLVLSDVPPGLHHVVVQSESGYSGYQSIQLEPGRTAGARISLLPPRIQEAASEKKARSTQIRTLYDVLGEHLDADLVLLAGQVDAETVAVQLFEPGTGNFSKIIRADAEGAPLEALEDLLPALIGYISTQGQIQADRVSFRVASLDISANQILANHLLAPMPIPVNTVVVTKMPRWVLWAGMGTVAAAAIPTGVILSNRDPGGQTETEGNGTIVVGPIP